MHMKSPFGISKGTTHTQSRNGFDVSKGDAQLYWVRKLFSEDDCRGVLGEIKPFLWRAPAQFGSRYQTPICPSKKWLIGFKGIFPSSNIRVFKHRCFSKGSLRFTRKSLISFSFVGTICNTNVVSLTSNNNSFVRENQETCFKRVAKLDALSFNHLQRLDSWHFSSENNKIVQDQRKQQLLFSPDVCFEQATLDACLGVEAMFWTHLHCHNSTLFMCLHLSNPVTRTQKGGGRALLLREPVAFGKRILLWWDLWIAGASDVLAHRLSDPRLFCIAGRFWVFGKMF